MATSTSAPWVPLVHPAMAALGLALAWGAARVGLQLREARLKGRRLPETTQARHLLAARAALALVLASFASGLASAVFVRDMAPMRSAHGWLAAAATACFAGAAAFGIALVKTSSGPRGRHVTLAMLGVLCAVVAALTGIELLP